MKKILLISLLLLSGCSVLHVHKIDTQQGNIMTQNQISQLHPGMTQDQVIAIMGNPVLMNTFRDDQMDYVYTFRSGDSKITEKRMTLKFKNGILKTIEK